MTWLIAISGLFVRNTWQKTAIGQSILCHNVGQNHLNSVYICFLQISLESQIFLIIFFHIVDCRIGAVDKVVDVCGMRTNLGCYRFNLGRRWSLLERIVVGALLNVWQSQLLVLLRQLIISWFGLFLLYNAVLALVISFKNLVKVIFFFRGYSFKRRSFEFFYQSCKSFTSVAFGMTFVRFVFNLWLTIYLYGGLLFPFPLLLNWRFATVLNKQIRRVNNN